MLSVFQSDNGTRGLLMIYTSYDLLALQFDNQCDLNHRCHLHVSQNIARIIYS